MPSSDEQKVHVRTKAVLIDAESMTVTWMNEPAAQDISDEAHGDASGLHVDQALPIAKLLGVPAALRAAAETGLAQHLQADLVSTARGSVLIVASIYPLPDRKLLLLMERGWQGGRGKDGERGSSRSEGRAR